MSGPNPQLTDPWLTELQDWRSRKDAYFASGRGPVAAGSPPLSYFAPDPAWNLRLPVTRTPSQPLRLATSSGETQDFVSYGQVTLPSGEPLLLLARAGEAQPESVFVPFRDATSGVKTYGAGRYLDAPLDGGCVLLDFNRAYHPYCAYSEGWTCPLPPAQNWLKGAVEAGERL